jgi:hypothetical protein
VRRPLRVRDIYGPRWSDVDPTMVWRIPVNRLRAATQRYGDVVADADDRVRALETQRADREREARRKRLGR